MQARPMQQGWNAHLATVFVIVGVGLRLWAYAANTSLWLDEVLIASNILGLSLLDLVTQPLRLDQVAPVGFLLLEKLSILILGPSELALRLVPLAFSVAGVFLFRRLAERTLGGLAVPFAVALFAIAVPFIRYGAEVKQYGADATVAVALTLMALHAVERERSTRRLVLIGVAGFLLVWVSQAAVLVMGGLGMACGAHWLLCRDPRMRQALLVVMPWWAVGALAALLVGLRQVTPATRAFMDDFWRPGFPPLPLSLPESAAWMGRQVLSLFSDPSLLGYPWPLLFLALATIGVVALGRRRPAMASLLLAPAAVCMAAALAHQYPFRGRLLLCLLPSLLIVVASGASSAANLFARIHPSLVVLCLIAFSGWPVATLVNRRPPYDHEHHRTVLRYLQAHRQPGDAIHVFPLTRIGVLFYGPRYGLMPAEWTTSVCDRHDTRAFLRDLDRYRGRARVWLLSSGAAPFRVARPTVQGYLAAIGRQRQSLDLPSSSQGIVSATLYDLSDPVRLASTDAESFPAPPMPTDPRPGCRPWVGADATLTVR